MSLFFSSKSPNMVNLSFKMFYPWCWFANCRLKRLFCSHFTCSSSLCPLGAFFLYTGLVALGLVFILGCLPETQGLQLEQIEYLFSGPLCSCGASAPGGQRSVQYIRVKGNNYLSESEGSDVD